MGKEQSYMGKYRIPRDSCELDLAGHCGGAERWAVATILRSQQERKTGEELDYMGLVSGTAAARCCSLKDSRCCPEQAVGEDRHLQAV